MRNGEAIAHMQALTWPLLRSQPALLNTLCSALLTTSDIAGAIDCLQSALVLAPGFLEASLNLCQAMLGAKSYEQGLKLLKQAADQHPNSLDARLALAIARMDLGFAAGARPLFAQTLYLGNDSPLVRRGLAASDTALTSVITGPHIQLRPFCCGRADFIQRAFNDRSFLRRMGRTWSVPGAREALETQLGQQLQATVTTRTALEWVLEAALLTLDLAFNHARLKKTGVLCLGRHP
ncbi:hypothetical protein QWZ03_15310 [Chitinimonas viridis]|uniref:Tetratricopeptide repeat protein n=1 Tax=Chitinimonas viridis TaxID=664880 RepID=A0ABT8B7Y4_9NEIS|nr:tetratricopeptide repeat protein [Chitinimonas viridis]MDN3578134.1 hypothetical protein [Chitinimonas viridis]